MRIERIELTGFKSFSEKTSFNFHPGITAVVGPNGCGKSNIVDAFRWVLGEQSAKSLRGDRMEDVIFSGSSSKKQKGMAEVTLFISGVNNGGSPEAGEISIARRLYRSGESEYLMNKIPCRLKDIKSVFLDTGLELKTYSILEQGRIDAILNSKPVERRFLIEEVAGVMKYNVRKAEAIQKLEASRLNLQRLQDIITEIKRQINSIDRHAKKAERYKRLFDEIKGIEIKIAVRDVDSFHAELLNLTALENTLKSGEAELSARIHSSYAIIEEKKLLCTGKEKALEEIQDNLHSAERELIEGEGKSSLHKRECENLRNRLQRLTVHDSEFTDEKEGITNQVKNIEQKNTDMNRELSDIEEVFGSRNSELLTLDDEIADLEENLELYRKELFNKAEESSILKNEISNLALTVENLEGKERKCFEDINSVKETVSSLDAAIRKTDDEYGNLGVRLKEKAQINEGLLDEIDRKKSELLAREENLYKEREALAAMSSRTESLKELDTGRKSAVKDNVKILCQVADIFETPPEYETAIEAALGEKLQAAVVEDLDEIKKALKLIKEQNINRSGFISAHMSPESLTSSPASSFSDGIIGKAIDFVKVKEGFDRIALSLLNDVLIVHNLDTVFHVRNKSSEVSLDSPRNYFVTLAGEILEPSGMVFTGVEKGILKIKREIKELDANIENKKADILSTEENISSFRGSLASVEASLASLEKEISHMEKTQHELELKLVNLREEYTRQQGKIDYLFVELDMCKNEKVDNSRTLDEKNKTCIAFEGERHSLEENIKGVQNGIADKKKLLETMRSELTETMLSRTAIREKMDSFMREEERLNSRLLEIEKKKEEIVKEQLEIEKNIKHEENEITMKQNSLKSFAVMISELQGKASELKEILEAKTAELSLIEDQQKASSDELISVRKELAQAEVKNTELSLRRNHIQEDIKRTYSVDIDRLAGEQGYNESLLPEEEEKLPDLKEKLQNIGPVNLGTLEELDELKTRYDFLTKQQDDLLQSVSSLQETILKINKTTQKKLTEAFEALNEKFKEVFTILFGKGRAELILTEGSILEAGIEIVAQPPGKKLQNLMLLSGGETALTALSLLFAGFMIKPTPLCILDEVDAPLDESNTDRFISLLKELARNIQFITITHNRRSMEAADYLYGITMEEPGVSKSVSMHLTEVA